MQQSSFNSKNQKNFLRTLAGSTQRFLVACTCIEKCRLCGREIALSIVDKQSENRDLDCHEEVNHASIKPERKSYARIFDTYAQGISKNQNSVATDYKSRTRSALLLKMQGIANRSKFRLFAKFDKLKPILSSKLALLREPTKIILNEFVTLTVAGGFQPQVPPAIIYFASHPDLSPRVSECLCNSCFPQITFDKPATGYCKLNSKHQEALSIASGVSYHGKIKDLIRAFKYEGDTTLASDLASIMSLGWSNLNLDTTKKNLIIVPVPLHKKRQLTRGFNQAELLAKEFGRAFSIKVSNHCLRRIKATRPQQVLGRQERLDNVKDAFVGESRIISGKTVVLVDDVFTSGSTLTACAEKLLECGAAGVVALTVATALLASEA